MVNLQGNTSMWPLCGTNGIRPNSSFQGNTRFPWLHLAFPLYGTNKFVSMVTF